MTSHLVLVSVIVLHLAVPVLCVLAEAHLSLLVKTQDIIAHTAGPATLHFMFVSKELLASKASAIVQLTVGQDPEQRALPRVHVAYHGHPGGRRYSSVHINF